MSDERVRPAFFYGDGQGESVKIVRPVKPEPFNTEVEDSCDRCKKDLERVRFAMSTPGSSLMILCADCVIVMAVLHKEYPITDMEG